MNRRRSIIALAGLAFLLLAANFLFTARYVNSSRAAQQHQEQEFQAAEKRQQEAAAKAGAEALEKVCGSFAKLAALQPPAGDPATNPSRAFDQQQHAILVGLGPDLGCR